MKKILFTSMLLVVALITGGCSEQQKWDHKQKEAMRELLKEYRNMIYLQDLTDSEFVIFTDRVAKEIEAAYPVYTTLIELPAMNDTVDMFVVTQIVDEINADAHNMRHLFPYDYLVAEGILPGNLTHSQQRDFYKCFAQKVNSYYLTPIEFLQDVLTSAMSDSEITQLQLQCANDLFGWVLEIDEVDIITQ